MTSALLGLALPIFASAMPAQPAVLPMVDHGQGNDFTLIHSGVPALVYVDNSANPAVKRVAGDLALDLARVAGTSPTAAKDVSEAAGEAVVIGVLGESPMIDRLVQSGRLPASLAGKWESAMIVTVSDPWPGVHKALVVAGSDRRGAIYGTYWISESLGISPWYWWADVPVPHRESAAIAEGVYALPSPQVQYRGIFLNDEDWTLRPWAAQTHDPKTGNIGPKTYARIFELLLRLRGNLLWPAMHPGTRDFNFYPEDKLLAEEYGVIMGSSHAEPMLRDNVDEWERDGTGEFNYVTNRGTVLRYWEDRVRTNGRFENIYTVGMRGIHDSGMEGGGTMAERADRLRNIIADQRQLLGKHVTKDLAKIPQMFCPYKEVLPLYQADPTIVPDDVTLVWPDDNYGYLQHLSTPAERSRSGGSGVYYHISYWGTPYDYLWLPSTPPALIGEEMTKAWRHGSSRIWVVNVGGLKPREWETEFFLRLAWNPADWQPARGQQEYWQRVVARDFGEQYAKPVTELLNEYYRLNIQRRPEHMGLDPGSPWLKKTVFAPGSEEAFERAAAFIALRRGLESIGAGIDAAHQPAFFELLAYPIHGAALMNLKWLGFERGQAAQERHEADRCFGAAAGAQAEIDRLVQTYDGLLDGKWRHMATSHPRERAVFDLPLPAAVPTVDPQSIWPATGISSRPVTTETSSFFTEREKVIHIQAARAANLVAGEPRGWMLVDGLGYFGTAVAARATATTSPDPAGIHTGCEYPIQITTRGEWKIWVRLLPTWPHVSGQPARITVAVDEGQPAVLALPAYQNEKDPVWQEDVLRNATIVKTAMELSAGAHVLRISAVDPDVVLDSILLLGPGETSSDYTWSSTPGAR